jgi:exodeoxyribonuclease III
MRIATYNVNGVNGRLIVLLHWLTQAQPARRTFSCEREGGPPRDLARTEGLEWRRHPGEGQLPLETRRGLPGDSEDLHSRYIEAEVGGLTIGCLYLPNGDPWPGPKFDYKLKWFERLTKHAAKLVKSDKPVILAGDYNVMPTETDVYKPERW